MPLKFDNINTKIIADIIEELRLQGHHLTGALERSLTDKVSKDGNGYTLSAEALGYIKELEEGVRPEHIATDARAIAEMTRYVELRNIATGKKAIKIAIAILDKQRIEGMPTRNSYQYSQTGERLDAIHDLFKVKGSQYLSDVETVVVDTLDDEVRLIPSGHL